MRLLTPTLHQRNYKGLIHDVNQDKNDSKEEHQHTTNEATYTPSLP
jgi:hypothetical protein